MGPERGMHKVEFTFFFLLIALFRLAQFLLSPLQQYQATTKFCQIIVHSTHNIMQTSLPFTYHSDASLEWIIAYCILTTMNLLHWIFREGLVTLWCIVMYWIQWAQLWHRHLCLSWQWWILYIFGLWNDLAGRPLRLIFTDPGWGFHKKTHRHLQPRWHRQVYRDHQY